MLLPRTVSPGRALEESAQEALRGGTSSQQFGGEIPGASGGGGGGQGFLGGDLEMLTPTEGVDFTSYLARIVASVKRNWLYVMPESARLGEQGRVVLQFRIFRDGLVPDSEPGLMGSSGKEPLDRAAISSIRASSPFPPLPRRSADLTSNCASCFCTIFPRTTGEIPSLASPGSLAAGGLFPGLSGDSVLEPALTSR